MPTDDLILKSGLSFFFHSILITKDLILRSTFGRINIPMITECKIKLPNSISGYYNDLHSIIALIFAMELWRD